MSPTTCRVGAILESTSLCSTDVCSTTHRGVEPGWAAAAVADRQAADPVVVEFVAAQHVRGWHVAGWHAPGPTMTDWDFPRRAAVDRPMAPTAGRTHGRPGHPRTRADGRRVAVSADHAAGHHAVAAGCGHSRALPFRCVVIRCLVVCWLVTNCVVTTIGVTFQLCVALRLLLDSTLVRGRGQGAGGLVCLGTIGVGGIRLATESVP